jgi:NADPH:quinone reductase-like Zn-dependent oxidoreductase
VIREQTLPSSEDLDDRGVLIKVHAWAMNPCDAILQTTPLPFVKYPVILGQDVAGTVEAVKPDSTAASKFQVGDRVFGFTANNGFQDYVTLDYTLMAKVPGDIPYRDAVVFGLTITTSSFSLFGKDFLYLDYPALGAPKKGKTLLVWGGSSAAGSNAIQLATGAGYGVITTCSPSNFEYVKSLGAVKAFDYSSPTITQDIVAEIDNGDCVGIYMAAGSNAAACQVSAASRQEVRGDGPHLSITPSAHDILTSMESYSSSRPTLSYPQTFLKASRPSSPLVPALALMPLPRRSLLLLVDTSPRHWPRECTRLLLRLRW